MSISNYDEALSLAIRREQAQPYELPVKSPIEAVLWYELRKVIDRDANVSVQVECEVKKGKRPFVLDFLVEIECRLIGLECDGWNYHQDRKSDAFRDNAIWKAGIAHRIYRLRGHDIYTRPHDLFDLLGKLEPSLFSTRGKIQVEVQASRCPHEDSFYWSPTGSYITDFPGQATRSYSEPFRDPDDDTDEPEYDPSPVVINYTGMQYIP